VRPHPGLHLLQSSLFNRLRICGCLFASLLILFSLTAAPDTLLTRTTSKARASSRQSPQTINWAAQGISWSVPADWTQMSMSDTFLHWKSPGAGDAAQLLVNISSMGPTFPAETSLKAMYDAAALRQKNNELSDLKWLELDGLKGVQYRENPPQNPEDVRRLQWQGYRKHGGQVKLVNIIISTQGKTFDQHQATMYTVLNSTKFPK
jgi:hypothetical protein